MSMISSSRDKFYGTATLFVCLVLVALTLSCQQARISRTAPDAPRPSAGISQPPVAQPPQQPSPVELKSVVVRPLDAAMQRLAGPEFLRAATDPLLIEVQTQRPLGNLARTSSPVIILNGEKFPDTYAINQTTLVAFLRDRDRIKSTNTIAVAWLGDEERTMSKTPLTFRSEDVRR